MVIWGFLLNSEMECRSIAPVRVRVRYVASGLGCDEGDAATAGFSDSNEARVRSAIGMRK